ncbi:MAG TPA: AarF/ABC1/UbiB kinase family protein, partial [Ilumatobacteraceae bacterium]|nr:AarF/ABC1/UbiB kinase family protein [Ilumatobacteraceae bacterium]
MTIAEDTGWGAFRDTGPWVLDRESLQWYPVAGLLRQAAKAGVPRLTRATRIPPGVRVFTVAARLIGAIAP